MQIQLNTDNNIRGRDALRDQVQSAIASTLDRFAERVTRVEVHLNDVNSVKGGDDKRCMLEARLSGREPIAVTHTAPSLDLALDGALDKLMRSLDSVVGKELAAQQNVARETPDAASGRPGRAARPSRAAACAAAAHWP
jgi:ribosome-associated translation inhibitor RaiA